MLLSLVAVWPCLAQFQAMEIGFEGIGCASCLESLPARIQRMRGVESATVDAERGILKVQLAAENRVRVEQVRDMIEQDGTKAKKAAVQVKGELSQVEGRWVLRLTGIDASYEVGGAVPASGAGTYVVTGDIAALRPESGRLVIRAGELKKSAK
jgi:hypothetical protein